MPMLLHEFTVQMTNNRYILLFVRYIEVNFVYLFYEK